MVNGFRVSNSSHKVHLPSYRYTIHDNKSTLNLKLLYLRFQQFPRKVNPAFDGSQRFLQHVRNFMVFVSVEIKEEGIPENFRQAMNGALDIADAEIAFCIIR